MVEAQGLKEERKSVTHSIGDWHMDVYVHLFRRGFRWFQGSSCVWDDRLIGVMFVRSANVEHSSRYLFGPLMSIDRHAR